MPLYMDYHKLPDITVDEAKQAHFADEKIQDKYGVKYLQFWVDENAGNLFCLVEGPDKPTVESVHRMAHGHIACAMVEVDPVYYALIMGDKMRIDQGLVRTAEGSVDQGYRTIMAVQLQSKAGDAAAPKQRKEILAALSKSKGRPVKLPGDDFMLSVFDTPASAFRCAVQIQEILAKAKKAKGGNKITFSIGLVTGQPVTENNEFIESTIRLARHLALVAAEGTILMSAMAHEMCEEELGRSKNRKVKSLATADDAFAARLFEILEVHLDDEHFTIDSLVKEMGISRPQLYRKIQRVAGKAPNDLIRDLRLEKSLPLLRRKSGNVSEIAFAVGFNNPSYFSKCFATKFGCLPSKFAVASAE